MTDASATEKTGKPAREKTKRFDTARFKTISDIAEELGVRTHVLRFWEGKFTQLKPLQRGGDRRYYRPEDVELLRGIQWFLKKDDRSIKGVQKILAQKGGLSRVREAGKAAASHEAMAPDRANGQHTPAATLSHIDAPSFPAHRDTLTGAFDAGTQATGDGCPNTAVPTKRPRGRPRLHYTNGSGG